MGLNGPLALGSQPVRCVRERDGAHPIPLLTPPPSLLLARRVRGRAGHGQYPRQPLARQTRGPGRPRLDTEGAPSHVSANDGPTTADMAPPRYLSVSTKVPSLAREVWGTRSPARLHLSSRTCPTRRRSNSPPAASTVASIVNQPTSRPTRLGRHSGTTHRCQAGLGVPLYARLCRRCGGRVRGVLSQRPSVRVSRVL